MADLKVSASILSSDFLRLGEEIRDTESAGVHSFHLDVMDGHLAPNLSFGPPIIKAVRNQTHCYLDVHLMIDQPWLFLNDYIELGVNSLLIHAEAYDAAPVDASVIKGTPRICSAIDVSRCHTDLAAIQQAGLHAGITLNPGTPLDLIVPLLDVCDSVLIMSVNPGFSGQAFIPDVLQKCRDLRQKHGYTGDIKIDGGVNADTAPACIEAGANVLISASYLYSSSDYSKAVQSLLS